VIAEPLSRSLPLATVTLATANWLTAEALAAARKLGFEAAVAVVDVTGSLRSFQRSDGAGILPVDVALRKAWTAAASELPTHVWNGFVSDASMAPMAALPQMMAVGGGFPLCDNGKVVGGIGVSGGDPDQDQKAAEQALARVGFSVP
jgi:uncharacterized protein GlcG (DUF336 family)